MNASAIGVLAPLRHRGFRLLAVGALTSLLGDGLFRVAIGLQVLTVRNDPRALAAVAIVWGLSQLLLLPVGGWLSDRVERRRIMIAADLWRATAIGALGVLSVTGALQLWHLFLLGGLFGAGNGFFNPASTSLVPDLLPGSELARANAFLGVARPTMLWIVGPLLGGLAISAGGPGVAFLIDAATFGVSAALLSRIAPRPFRRSGQEGAHRTASSIAEGYRFVRSRPWAWVSLLVAGLGTLAYHGPFDVLVPYLLLNDLNLDEGQAARALALILASGGLGSILASTVIGQRDLPRRFVTGMYTAEGLALLASIGFGLTTRLWHALLTAAAVHAMFATSEIIWTTMQQRLVPREMLGRVSSLDWMTSVGLAPLSFAVASLGAHLGARRVIVGAGLIGGTAVLALLGVARAREPERAVAPSPTAAPAEPVWAVVEPAADSGLGPGVDDGAGHLR